MTAKPGFRLYEQLSDFLDAEMAWRTRELHAAKDAIRRISASAARQSAFLRASVPLVYAHWEGFVKIAAEKYLYHVLAQRLKYSELRLPFLCHGHRHKLDEFASSGKHAYRVETVAFLLSSGKTVATFKPSSVVDTESNLSSQVFANICAAIGIDDAPYKLELAALDKSLVKTRNEIAHGEYILVDEGRVVELVDQVLDLMKRFQNDVANAAASKAYRAS